MIIINNSFPFVHYQTRASLENPATTTDQYFAGFGGGQSSSGVLINENTAITLSAVWRAINIISTTLASLPVSLYRQEPNGDKTNIINHPGIKLFQIEPNPNQTSFIFTETIQTGLLTWGNGYAYILRDGIGNPVGMNYFHPSEVTMKTNNNRIFYDITGFKDNIPARDILHIPGLGYDGYLGKSPLQIARESLSGGLSQQTFGNTFYKNGALQSGVLETPQKLGKEAWERLKESFGRKYAGLANSGGTMVLEEGLKYNPISFPLEQIQFLGLKQFTVVEVARWFGLPPHFLADLERSTYSNIEHQSIEFVVYSLRGWLKRWESEMNKKLLKESERPNHSFKFNVDALLRGDNKSRAEWYRTMSDLGVYSVNDIRRLENKNGVAGGDVHLVQLARTPLTDIGNQQNN